MNYTRENLGPTFNTIIRKIFKNKRNVIKIYTIGVYDDTVETL